MKRSTIAAIAGAFAAAAAVVAVADCMKPPETPGSTPQDAMASDASRLPRAVRKAALTASGGAGPTYLNYPSLWDGTTQLQQFFHLSEGSEVFPYGALLAIDATGEVPFFDPTQPTYGLLVEPKDATCDQSQQWCNSYGVPVGMTVAITRDLQLLGLNMVGFNCAACHVGELQAGGNMYRVLGGPNMFDAIGWVIGLKNAVGYTKGNVVAFLAFLARWAAEGDTSNSSAIGATNAEFLTFVNAAAPSVLASRSPIGLALANALRQTYTQVSSEVFPPRGPGLHVVVPGRPAPQQTLEPTPIRPGSRPDVPPGKTAYAMPPTRPTMASVASLANTELAALNKTFSVALSKTSLDVDAQALPPFEAALAKVLPANRLLVLESLFVDFREALALLKERYAALSALGNGGVATGGSTMPGPGRVDAFMTARNILFPDSATPATSPVDIPRIWNLLSIPWYHWDGNTNSLIERNIGQAVVIGAVIDPANYQSTLLIENIQQLETLAGALPAPPWPSEIDAGAGDGGEIARGEQLFNDNCRHCHGSGNDAGTALPEVKTDELRIRNFSLPMDGGGQFNVALKAELDAIMQQAYAYADAAADAQEDPRNTTIRALPEYANRSLEGVWATAPYLHNGSVASLADLLEPVSARSSVVTVGGRLYDTDRVGYAADAGGAFSRDGGAKGDSICGHDYDAGCGHVYGTQLAAEDKKALLDYLKSL